MDFFLLFDGFLFTFLEGIWGTVFLFYFICFVVFRYGFSLFFLLSYLPPRWMFSTDSHSGAQKSEFNRKMSPEPPRLYVIKLYFNPIARESLHTPLLSLGTANIPTKTGYRTVPTPELYSLICSPLPNGCPYQPFIIQSFNISSSINFHRKKNKKKKKEASVSISRMLIAIVHLRTPTYTVIVEYPTLTATLVHHLVNYSCKVKVKVKRKGKQK